VLAAKDVPIAAASVHNVQVISQLNARDNWLVEKVIIGVEDLSLLAAPTR
jgi:hypothetical protein